MNGGGQGGHGPRTLPPLESLTDRKLLELVFEELVRIGIELRQHTDADREKWAEVDTLMADKRRRDTIHPCPPTPDEDPDDSRDK